jgi:hypothetical protein
LLYRNTYINSINVINLPASLITESCSLSELTSIGFDVFWPVISYSESESVAFVFKSDETLIAQCGKFEDVGHAGMNEDN